MMMMNCKSLRAWAYNNSRQPYWRQCLMLRIICQQICVKRWLTKMVMRWYLLGGRPPNDTSCHHDRVSFTTGQSHRTRTVLKRRNFALKQSQHDNSKWIP